MTWFQAFKIAFWGGRTGHVVGRQRREPPNVMPQALFTEEETLPTRDKITPEQPGQGDAEKLDNECKDEDNNVATTSDNLGDVALQTRDQTKTEPLRKEDAVSLGSESKGEGNLNTTAVDGIDEGYKEFLNILNAPSLSPASASEKL